MNGKCNVILNGTVLEGFNYQTVVEQLSKLFKVDQHKAACLLDRKKHLVKKEIDRETAEKYKRAFLLIGASCDLEMVQSVKLDIDLPPELKVNTPTSSTPFKEPTATAGNAYCATCGGKLQDEANYCHVCGASVHHRAQTSTKFTSESYHSNSTRTQGQEASSGSQSSTTSSGDKLGYWDFALLPFKNYATFEGRSRRREYWSFFLLASLGQFCISFIFGFIQGFLVSFTHGQMGYGISQWGNILSFLFGLGIIIPMIAVGIRRLHDTNRSGWWLLLPIVNFVLLALDGDKSANRFGTPIVK